MNTEQLRTHFEQYAQGENLPLQIVAREGVFMYYLSVLTDQQWKGYIAGFAVSDTHCKVHLTSAQTAGMDATSAYCGGKS